MGIRSYKSEGEWRWRATSGNGKIVGASSEGFKNKTDCEANLHALGQMWLAVILTVKPKIPVEGK